MSDEIFYGGLDVSAHPMSCLCGAHGASSMNEPWSEAVAENGKPIFTLPEIIAQLTRNGTAWNGVGGNPIPNAGLGTIGFGFFNSSFEVYSSERNQFQPLSEAQRVAVREAFAVIDDLINISFVETSVAWADINLGNLVTSESYYSAYANYPDNTRKGGDIWFNTNAPSNFEITPSQPGFRTILHEIFHALGISHPGNYNATAGVTLTYAANAEYYQDLYEYTIMSYFGSSNTGAIRDSFAATPMAHDVAAIQAIYGADMTTRTGDTVYGFNSNAGRSLFDFTTNILPVIAIWDAGGIDTLDFSGWNSASKIDLSEGGFSNGGGQTSNVQIAFGTLIENAVGGGGDDIIIGNNAANIFFLQFGGADTVYGRDGNDGFYFGAALDARRQRRWRRRHRHARHPGQLSRPRARRRINGVEVLLAASRQRHKVRRFGRGQSLRLCHQPPTTRTSRPARP